MSSRIKKDIMSVIGGRVFTSGLYFIFIGFLMTFLTVEDYGMYTYYYSLIAMIPFFIDLGTNNAFLALGAKKLKESTIEFDKYKSNYLVIKYVLFFAFFLLALFLFSFKHISNTLFFVVIIGITVALLELMANLLAVKKAFSMFSILMPVRNILILVIVLFVISFDYINNLNVFNSLLILGLATFISLFIYLIFIRDYTFKKTNLALNVCRELCSYSSWLVIYGFCVALMMRIDIFIIEYYSGDGDILGSNELGYFSAAFSLSLILPMITNSIVKVAFPSISQISYASDVDKYISLIKKAIAPVFLAVLIFMLIVVTIVNMFFYQKYGGSISVFLLISLATMISFYTNLLIPLFYVSNKTFFIAKLGVIQLLVNAIASFILIYFYGAVGAAISILIVRSIGLIILGRNIKTVKRALN